MEKTAEEIEKERSRKYWAARTQADLDKWDSPKATEIWNERVQALIAERDARIARERERERALLAGLTQEQLQARKLKQEREQEQERERALRAALAQERKDARQMAWKQYWENVPGWLALVMFFGAIFILQALLSK